MVALIRVRWCKLLGGAKVLALSPERMDLTTSAHGRTESDMGEAEKSHRSRPSLRASTSTTSSQAMARSLTQMVIATKATLLWVRRMGTVIRFIRVETSTMASGSTVTTRDKEQ